MYSFTRSTAAQNAARVNDDGGTAVASIPSRRSLALGGINAGSGRRGARSVAMIASIRAHARSYAAIARSGRDTNGVATTFSVWRRLSKISSVSATTMYSGG